MNLRRTWTILLACSVVALLITAPSASAKPGYFVMAGYHSVELDLKSSHGYRIHIEKRGRRSIYLLASTERSTVAYVAPSLAPKGSEIKARLPGVGRVSMRFRPQGPPQEEKPPSFPGCKGGARVEQPGYFVGTIRFRGERGYTSVRSKRARGVIKTVAKEVCKRFDEDPEPISDRIELNAFSRSDLRAVGFSASGSTDPELTSSTVFSAGVAERRRGMEIYRGTFATGKRRDLVLGDIRPFPLSATVTPPPPFQGSAEFQRDAEGNSTWTGSLTVPFPGLGPVALTGPDFTARLCQQSGCTGSSVDGHSLPLPLPDAVE